MAAGEIENNTFARCSPPSFNETELTHQEVEASVFDMISLTLESKQGQDLLRLSKLRTLMLALPSLSMNILSLMWGGVNAAKTK